MQVRSCAARGALVVLVAIGVLAMHGLATAAAHGPPVETAVEAPGVTALVQPTSDAEHGHDALGHLGAACIWLLVGTGTALACGLALRRGNGSWAGPGSLASPVAEPTSPTARSPGASGRLRPLIC
jgi:hypothetical protein